MVRRTDAEVMTLLRGNSALNKARQIFSSEAARIEQESQQRHGLPPIEMRRLEFEAVEKVAAALNADQQE
jgi:hypothetical protein